MINSISSNSSMISSLQPSNANFAFSMLTDDQKSAIQDILSNYDPENITKEDAKEIWQAFQDAGIQPQEGLKEVIERKALTRKISGSKQPVKRPRPLCLQAAPLVTIVQAPSTPPLYPR